MYFAFVEACVEALLPPSEPKIDFTSIKPGQCALGCFPKFFQYFPNSDMIMSTLDRRPGYTLCRMTTVMCSRLCADEYRVYRPQALELIFHTSQTTRLRTNSIPFALAKGAASSQQRHDSPMSGPTQELPTRDTEYGIKTRCPQLL